jgi:heme-degrading monooxygenase HmoA
MAIIRVYRARTHAGMDKEFERFLLQEALPLMRKQNGCIDVHLGKTKWGGSPEFVMVSRWDSIDSIKQFAGPDWQSPRILPEEAHMVKQVFCDHYELLTP